MADAARLSARALPWVLLTHVAGCFALPTEAACAWPFYGLVAPAVLAGLGREPAWRCWWPAWTLIAWSGLTLLWSEGDARRIGAFALGTVCTGIFMRALQVVLASPRWRRRLAGVLIWSGCANAAWSIARGLAMHTIAPQLVGWGLTHHPILGASVMDLCVLTAAWRALSEKRRRWQHWLAAGVMLAFVLLTESRGPLLALTLGGLALGLLGPWARRLPAVLAALVAGGLLAPAGWRAQAWSVLTARGDHHRFEIWRRTLALARARPWLGHGLGAELDLPGMSFPHSLYLSALFYSGAVGLALLAVLIAAAMRRAWASPERPWLMAIWVSALACGLTDLGQVTKGPGPLWLIFWLPAGLALGPVLAERRQPPESPQ